VIGGQFVLIRDNYNEAEHLAAVLRRIGLDYLIIKPYSRHPSSHNVISSNLPGRKFYASIISYRNIREENLTLFSAARPSAKI